MRMLRVATILAATCAGLALAVACGGGDDASSPPAADGGATPPPPANPNPNPNPPPPPPPPPNPPAPPNPPPPPADGGTFETLASGMNDAYGIALDDTNVYVTVFGDKTVRRIPKTGGTATTIGSSSLLFWGIAVANGVVYWGAETNVQRVLVDGGSAGPALGSGTSITGVAVDDTNVYYTNYTGHGAYSAPLAGGAGLSWGTSDQTFRIAVDATNVYYGVGNSVYTAPKGSTPATVLTNGSNFVDGIAVDATYVYFADRDAGKVYRASKTTPSTATPIAQGLTQPAGIAVDGAYVYVTEYQGPLSGGRILRIHADGSGTPDTLASGQLSPFTIAVDATYVYWTTYETDGKVRRTLK